MHYSFVYTSPINITILSCAPHLLTLKVNFVKCKICKGLDFIHGRGVAHLDVKPDNIYVKNGIYKLGDFGCATLIDRSLAIEEGDSRYMPPEMLNEKHEHLDKVDIFSLGAAVYELIRGTPLPVSGHQFASLREGKISLLPGHPMQFQSLIKVWHHHHVAFSFPAVYLHLPCISVCRLTIN